MNREIKANHDRQSALVRKSFRTFRVDIESLFGDSIVQHVEQHIFERRQTIVEAAGAVLRSQKGRLTYWDKHHLSEVIRLVKINRAEQPPTLKALLFAEGTLDAALVSIDKRNDSVGAKDNAIEGLNYNTLADDLTRLGATGF